MSRLASYATLDAQTVVNYLETVRLVPQGGKDPLPTSWLGAQVLQWRKNHSMAVTLVALGFVYSVHNVIAPNLTAIAKNFKFNDFERDEYIGGELTLFFYMPGIFVAILFGMLSAFMSRRLLFTVVIAITATACFSTTFVSNFTQLAVTRTITGFGIGGALPIVYSMVGDWFPAERRSSGTAYVTAACGIGVFFGQCIAALTGTIDWRWPFVVCAVPMFFLAGVIYFITEDPQRGGAEESIQNLQQQTGMEYSPNVTTGYLKSTFANRTNILVVLQAFPGNVPWGVVLVYLSDFLVQDIGLSQEESLVCVAVMAGSAFCGVLFGGWLGEYLYAKDPKCLAIFVALNTSLRAIPFFFIFGWVHWFGPLQPHQHFYFYVLLTVAGFVSSMASPGMGAMLLNVNLPETRGTVFAIYSVLDDLSKGFGTLFVSMIVPYVGGRAFAYQLALMIWVVCGLALLPSCFTLSDDEAAMKDSLNEAAMESIVRVSKVKAHAALKGQCALAGQAVDQKRAKHSAFPASFTTKTM
mmetsp:Transcript_41227/g.89875  ORF Transcript_41227/g.89875 Transcript_41227/m.89875 type:complete len:524 (+) Transcript_41227:228-1799(+)